jgi:SAM-dependent methyltransferase
MRSLLRSILALASNRRSAFSGSTDYWRRRYARGGDSGSGSYGAHAVAKAHFLNSFVADNRIASVIEFGCGDGNQLALADYPSYLGLDVSEAAIARCRRRFAGDASKRFMLVKSYSGEQADLSLSLDVVYHVVEDEIYDAYMRMLFAAAQRFVVVFSTNSAEKSLRQKAHVRHRIFTSWVDENQNQWELVQVVPGEARSRPRADFHVFARRD